MKKRLVLFYSGNIVYGHYFLWVDEMTSDVVHNNPCWPWFLPVSANFFLEYFQESSVIGGPLTYNNLFEITKIVRKIFNA